MPRAIGIIRWDNQLGPFLESGYPDTISLTPTQLTNLYTSQTLGDITTPRLTLLSTEELKIITYFGGLQDPSLLVFFLEDQENAEIYKNFIINSFVTMPQDNSLIKSWVKQIYEKAQILKSRKNHGIEYKDKLIIILSEISDHKIKHIDPKFSFEKGIQYPEIERITNIPHSEMRRLLEILANCGYLLRDIQDCYPICPECRSTKVQMKLNCPVCKSSALQKTLITEHFLCGTKTISEKFITAQGMACPKCDIQLKTDGIDYTNLGIFYFCHQCKNFSNNPTKILFCHNCNNSFPEENANISLNVGYKVNQDQLHKFVLNPTPSLFRRLENE